MHEIDESIDFQKVSYKQLQTFAKQWSLPANMQRQVLVEALTAHRNGDLQHVENAVNAYKAARKRRIGLNKSQNLSSSTRQKKSLKLKRDESVVDSTSQEVGSGLCVSGTTGEFTPSSSMEFSSLDNYPSNYFCSKVRMNSLNQQHQHVAKHEKSNALDMSGDTHFVGHPTSYNNQLNYKNTLAPSTPFDVLKYSSQNSTQYYQQPDVATKSFMHYTCGQTYYPNPHSQSTCFSNNCNINYSSGSDNYSQLPNYVQNSSLSVMQYNNTVANKNNSYNMNALASLSQSNYYGKDSNNISSMETDYSSPYLPNIPQLADITAENTQTSHFLPSWSQEALHSNESRRYMYEAQNQGMVVSSQNLNQKPTNSENGNLSFDRYYDEETLSLNEDVANLLEVNKTVDSHKLNSLSMYGINSDSSYYNIRPHREYNNAIVCPTQTNTCSQNDSNLSNYSIDNIVASQTPLPPISTLFNGTTNHNYASVNDHYQQEPYQEVSSSSYNNSACTDSTFASFTSENEASYMNGCRSHENSSRSELSCINLITPTTSPLASDASNSILRNHLQVDQHLHDPKITLFGRRNQSTAGSPSLQHQLMEKARKKNNVGFRRVNTDDKSSSVVPVPFSVSRQKPMQDMQETPNSEFQNKEDTADVSQLIYESETLHRSKIIYNFSNKDSFRGENIRKYMHVFEYGGIPKRKLEFQPVTVLNRMDEQEAQKKTDAFAVVPVYHHPCKNKVRGCGVILQAELLQRHEKRCLFEPISCPSDACSWRNSMKLLTLHIYEDHADKVERRKQFLFTLDRKKCDDGTHHTYYQVYKKTIYVIQLHVEDNKCVASIQYIQEMDVVFRQEKPANVMMQMYAFCNKIRMKSWTGVARPYYDNNGQKHVDLMINVRNSEFIGLRLVID